MPMNIFDAEDAFMAGNALFEEWLAEFEAGWNEPMDEMKAVMLWEKMTPEMREYYKKNNPEAYADIEKYVKEIQSRKEG